MKEAEPSAAEASKTPLWTFAVELYGKPGVADACLALQDRHGCDVNLLLFAAWMGEIRHHTLSADELAEAAQAVREWHAEIVRPLRGVRRRMKSGPPPAPDAESEALRNQIKSVEIEAERIELATLEKRGLKWHAQQADGAGQTALTNMAAALRHFAGGDTLAEDTLDLIRAIARAAGPRSSLSE